MEEITVCRFEEDVQSLITSTLSIEKKSMISSRYKNSKQTYDVHLNNNGL